MQRLWEKVQIKKRLQEAQGYKGQFKSKRKSFDFDAKHSCWDNKHCFEELTLVKGEVFVEDKRNESKQYEYEEPGGETQEFTEIIKKLFKTT